jgi:hypothetical protein
MKKMLAVVFLFALLVSNLLATFDVAPAKAQIASALLAAPEERREDATVLGYEQDSALVTLKNGSNDLVCLADKPGDDTFSVACYHEDLEPFMARGRELLLQGITGAKRRDIRFDEIKNGELPMSREPRLLYVLTGSGFDTVKGVVTEPYLRYVIYLPFATAESTGLSEGKGSPGAPWLMGAGMAGAHIMINPPK